MSHDTNLSTSASVCIAIISGIPVLVNIVYVIVCFKTLKRKFHNLLVLTLCISDCFLAVSLMWFIIASLIDSLRTNVKSCLFQTFAVGYGFVTSYSIILLICLERYAVVKAMNFGVKKTLDRFKYLAIGGTLALGFMYTIETVLFTRAEETIATCSIPNLYGDRFYFFVTFMIGGVTIILLLIICVTMLTGYHIWELFYRQTAVHSCVVDHNPTTDKLKNVETGSQQYAGKSDKEVTGRTSAWLSKTEAGNDRVVPFNLSCQCTQSNESYIIHEPCIDNTSSDEYSDCKTNVAESLISSAKSRQSNVRVQRLIMQMKTERLNSAQHNTVKQGPLQKKTKQRFRFGAWEFRAFATSIIIALTTILLTGPFIVSFWVDWFNGTYLPLQIRFWLVVPLMINSIVNPFIYAWRIPEIRKELKKAFYCHM